MYVCLGHPTIKFGKFQCGSSQHCSSSAVTAVYAAVTQQDVPGLAGCSDSTSAAARFFSTAQQQEAHEHSPTTRSTRVQPNNKKHQSTAQQTTIPEQAGKGCLATAGSTAP